MPRRVWRYLFLFMCISLWLLIFLLKFFLSVPLIRRAIRMCTAHSIFDLRFSEYSIFQWLFHLSFGGDKKNSWVFFFRSDFAISVFVFVASYAIYMSCFIWADTVFSFLSPITTHANPNALHQQQTLYMSVFCDAHKIFCCFKANNILNLYYNEL